MEKTIRFKDGNHICFVEFRREKIFTKGLTKGEYQKKWCRKKFPNKPKPPTKTMKKLTQDQFDNLMLIINSMKVPKEIYPYEAAVIDDCMQKLKAKIRKLK